MPVRIFLSAVSDEFRHDRDRLRRDHNVEVKVQEEFKESGTLRCCTSSKNITGTEYRNGMEAPFHALRSGEARWELC